MQDENVRLIEQAIAVMRTDADPSWQAVAGLMSGGPLGLARLAAGRANAVTDYPDVGRAVAVARAYLDGHTGEAQRTEWAVEVVSIEGDTGYAENCKDENHAEGVANSLAIHDDVKSTAVVTREVRTGPWRHVRAGDATIEEK